jgi:hypothetical protein
MSNILSSTPDAPWAFSVGGINPSNPNEASGLGGTEWSTRGYWFYSKCDFAELLFYDTGAMSTEDRQLAEGILAWKWGLQGDLPADHPWKDTNPIPEPSTLVLLAIGAIALLAYGWQRAKRAA